LNRELLKRLLGDVLGSAFFFGDVVIKKILKEGAVLTMIRHKTFSSTFFQLVSSIRIWMLRKYFTINWIEFQILSYDLLWGEIEFHLLLKAWTKSFISVTNIYDHIWLCWLLYCCLHNEIVHSKCNNLTLTFHTNDMFEKHYYYLSTC
jgi:hypothetical protein